MDITFTSPFSFLVAAAFADAGGGADGRGTDDGETGPVSGSDGKKTENYFRIDLQSSPQLCNDDL